MKIVIVDDDKQAAYDLEARLLKSYKIEVAGVALNGLDGLALVNKHRPDVLFLDVQLPDISGLDFLDRIDDFTDGDCRVVMYTAYDKFILPAFRKKAFDVLLKPIDNKDLALIMGRLEEAGIESLPYSARGVSLDENGLSIPNPKDDKFLLYTNGADFKLVDKRDIGVFKYNHEGRCWEVVVAGVPAPVRLKRNVKSESLAGLDKQFVQVNQKYIINMDYLIEVVDNVCHFYPPFDNIDYVKVAASFARSLSSVFAACKCVFPPRIPTYCMKKGGKV